MTMERFRKRLTGDCRGNVAIEFALVMPLFILMIMAIADYGRAMMARAQLDAAARAGLQVLVRNIADVADAQSAAQGMAPGATVSTSIACVCTNGVAVACSPGTCPVGVPRRTATVAVNRSYTLLFPWPEFDDPMPLAAKAVGRLQ
jgi:Flp pilus assembly protein TadG